MSGLVKPPVVCALVCLLWAVSSMAAPQFPQLTGRVMDLAGMLSAQTEQQVARLSEAHEHATGNQVVIVTLPDLQGYSVEEFGYQLGRAWGIGQQGKDNGVLLLIAEAERKIRIEVGYGLEGALTDAVSSNIIYAVITPRFKRAQFDQGVLDGTAAIIAALGGEYQVRDQSPPEQQTSSLWKVLAFIILFFVLPAVFGRGRFLGGLLLGSALGHSRGRRGGGGFGGGGFSGGGGGFGGGGASGGW